MPLIPFERMPDDARAWVFGVGRELNEAETADFLGAVDSFLEGWAAHGTPLTAARDFRHGRFLIVAVDEASVPPSGCSIDAMVHVLKGQEESLGTPIVDNTPVWFLTGDGAVGRASREEFRSLRDGGDVGPETVVFDNTITRVGQVRGGQWERPAAESWHGRAFFRDALRG